MKSTKSKKIFVIFLIIFIDLLGFGIVIPLLPSFSVHVLHMSESTIGIAAGIFSLMQFIFNPLWGRLSDIFGRKPIILFSLTGNVLSYILLGLVFSGVLKSVLLLFIARGMAGFFSANIGAAMAYISDITDHKERSKGMGLIGTAFSLGFVFGPFLGGFLTKKFDFGIPVFLSAGLSLIALILSILILEESLPKELRSKFHRSKIYLGIEMKLVINALKLPNVGFLIILFFIITFSIANIYATFQLYAESSDGFNFDVEKVSYLFAYLGIVGAFVQGILLRFLLKIINERKLLIIGNFLMAFGLGTIPLSQHNIFFLLTSLFLLGLGNGLNQPLTISLISQFTHSNEQGGILGINQSLASLARFLGPSWGGFVYEKLGYYAPFLTGGIFMFFGSFVSLRILHKSYETSKLSSQKSPHG